MIEIYAMALFPLEEEETFQEHIKKISEERREKIKNLKNKKSKRQSLGAWLLLEYGLKELGIVKGEIGRTKNGKLYVKDRDEIDFNISHSGDYAVCTIGHGEGRGIKVGVDLEKRRKRNVLPIAERFFPLEEYEKIKGLKEEENIKLFHSLWTEKESYVKAIGIGITYGLDSFVAEPCPKQAVRKIVDKRMEESFFTKEYDGIEGYSLTVCGNREVFAEKIRWVNPPFDFCEGTK